MTTADGLNHVGDIMNVYYTGGLSYDTVHRGGGPGGRVTPGCKPHAAAGRYATTDRSVTCKECLRLP